MKWLNSSLAAIVLASTYPVALAADMAVLDPKHNCEKPAYPRASLMNEEQGTVTIALQIGADGTPTDTRIEKSSGYKNLDKAARTALALCKFKPTGNPQNWVVINYEWKL